MSKKASQRQRGWIEFKGLQFAEPFAARSELVRIIHAFFEKRGVSLTNHPGPLQVRFTRERNPTSLIDGKRVIIAGQLAFLDNLGGATPLVVKEVIVHIRHSPSRKEFLTTLGHELDHAVWVLEGRTFDDTEKYWNRPHEVRARQEGSEWSQCLSR